MSDAPREIEPEPTGVTEMPIDDRRRIRAGRTTENRFEHIEENVDALKDGQTDHAARLGKVEVIVSRIDGKMDVVPELVDSLKDAVKDLRARDHQVFTQRTTVETAMTLDGLDKKRNRRERITKAVGAVLSGAGIVELLHRLLG